MKVIGFNLSGKYALFTKPYTKNQPQSFIIPPKTAITGMIGGILGFKRDEYQDRLKNLEYSVVVKDFKKYTTRFNLLQGKNATFGYSKNPLRNPPERGQRSPTTFELLKNPSWDIFVSVEDNLLEELQDRIKRNLYVYEPYLGVANAFAKLNLFQEIVELKKGISKIKSFFELDLVKVKLIKPTRFYNELIPIGFESERNLPITKEMVVIMDEFEVLNKKEIENEFFIYKDYSLRFI
ncbi:MAG: type I-B CRISPR-associated protein Cas5b [Nautiliaceae bacterium]